MPRPRFDKLDPDKRKRIIEAAGRAFGENGFEGASLNQILDAAGISKGAAYYYFDDKVDLFATVVNEYFQDMLGDVGQLLDNMTRDNFWQVIEEYYRQTMISFTEEPWLLGLVRAMWQLPADMRTHAALADMVQLGEQWLTSLIHHGQQLGVVRTDVPLPLLVAWFFGLDLATDHWMAEHLTALTPEVVDAVSRVGTDVMRRLFEVRPDDARLRLDVLMSESTGDTDPDGKE